MTSVPNYVCKVELALLVWQNRDSASSWWLVTALLSFLEGFVIVFEFVWNNAHVVCKYCNRTCCRTKHSSLLGGSAATGSNRGWGIGLTVASGAAVYRMTALQEVAASVMLCADVIAHIGYTLHYHHSNRTGFQIVTHTKAYGHDMANSVFCGAPTGGGHGKRNVLVTVLGCIPVTVTDNVYQPFEPEIHWDKFSVALPEADIPQMHVVLANVTEDKREYLQANLWCGAQHLFWSSIFGGVLGDDGRYDAFETVRVLAPLDPLSMDDNNQIVQENHATRVAIHPSSFVCVYNLIYGGETYHMSGGLYESCALAGWHNTLSENAHRPDSQAAATAEEAHKGASQSRAHSETLLHPCKLCHHEATMGT
eukprot:364100-Chlamydomonas_euryale.AAC.20